MNAPAFITYILDTTNPFMKQDGLLADSCPTSTCETRLAKHGKICGLCHQATNLNITPTEDHDLPAIMNELTYAQYNALFPVPPGFGRFMSFACLVSAQGEMQDYEEVFAWTPKAEQEFRRCGTFDISFEKDEEEDMSDDGVSPTTTKSLTDSEGEVARSLDLERSWDTIARVDGTQPINVLDTVNLSTVGCEGDEEVEEVTPNAFSRAGHMMISLLPLLTNASGLFEAFSKSAVDLDIIDIVRLLAAGMNVCLMFVDPEPL